LPPLPRELQNHRHQRLVLNHRSPHTFAVDKTNFELALQALFKHQSKVAREVFLAIA